jgi:hypothetical protein
MVQATPLAETREPKIGELPVFCGKEIVTVIFTRFFFFVGVELIDVISGELGLKTGVFGFFAANAGLAKSAKTKAKIKTKKNFLETSTMTQVCCIQATKATSSL